MEIVEVISHYIDKTQNLINVEFRLMGDEDTISREDFIEYLFFEEFGYDNKKPYDLLEGFLSEDELEEEWEEDEYDYFDNEDELISFLNEYYIVYPQNLPKAQMK